MDPYLNNDRKKKTQLHLTIIFELEEVREEMVEGNCMIQAKFSL